MAETPQTETPHTDDAAKFSRLGVRTAIAVFGGLFLWSILAPIDSAVIAPGQIVVETKRKTIQHLEGGVIREILVKDGDAVKAGDVLIRLEDTMSRANADIIEAQIAELIARQARLYAERDGLAEIPPDSLAFRLAPKDLDYSANLEGQKRLLAARNETRATQIALLGERAVQQDERIRGYDTQIRSLKEQARLIAEELEGVKRLNAEGYAPMTRVRALERDAESIIQKRGQLVAAKAESESVISESRLEILRLKEQTREDALKESTDIEVEIASLVEKRGAASEQLKRTSITAPEDGVVLGLAVHTEGGVIAPGAPVMELVPKGDRLIIAARIAPKDVDKVEAGDETLIRFAALNSRVTPEVIGAVRQVSADNLVDAKTGEPFYQVLIELPADATLASALKGQALVPGMPTESFIRTGAQPAISYLLRPLTDAFSRSLREE